MVVTATHGAVTVTRMVTDAAVEEATRAATVDTESAVRVPR